jgi:tRNA-dihydrouridine synthase
MHAKPIKIWLAPLRGFTDVVFRNVYHAYYMGIDGAITPFLTTVKGERIRRAHLKDVLLEENRGLCVIPQILSKTAAHFIVLARHLYDMGYDTINWNLGCPYPMVAKKGRGSGMLPHKEKIAVFLDNVMAGIPNRLSIKLRLGYHHSDEIDVLFPIFDQYPLQELILHPRTGKQMYDGTPDEDAFEACLARTTHRIVYNGDIRTIDDYQRLQHKFPTVTKWMIGRGILSNPELPARIKGHAMEKTKWLETFVPFHEALMDGYARVLHGPGHLLNRMKGFWRYFALNFEQGHRHIKKIYKSRSLDAYRTHVGALFDAEQRLLEDKG